jgi:hypothetical protein
MSRPDFFDRVADATLPIVGTDRDVLTQRIDATRVGIVCEDDRLADGFLAAVDLAARFYGTLSLVAPAGLRAEAEALAKAINPNVEFTADRVAHRLRFAAAEPESETEVCVAASGWNVLIDQQREDLAPPAGPALLAAAAIGVGALFRAVFADLLPRGRGGAEPGSLNLVDLSEFNDLPVPEQVVIGKIHLAGAGAIGQATVAALRRANARGEIVLVDHERLELSNLQRYFGTQRADVGTAKTKLAARALDGSTLRPRESRKRWGESRDSAPGKRVVLAALDTGTGRIGVQAGLHGKIYNAFTGPADFGWSRHEHFGNDPCLACLYWPRGRRPHRYELIAKALDQHALRVRLYLALNAPVGIALPPLLEVPGGTELPSPEEFARWFQVSLLEDIAPRYALDDAARTTWSTSTVGDLFRAMCGGALVRVSANATPVAVPLAHQSLLAGVMLAVSLIVANDPALRAHRPPFVQARWDVRRRLPTSFEEPASIAERCLCRDDLMVNAWQQRTRNWSDHDQEAA